jgi:hypothetical protein
MSFLAPWPRHRFNCLDCTEPCEGPANQERCSKCQKKLKMTRNRKAARRFYLRQKAAGKGQRRAGSRVP